MLTGNGENAMTGETASGEMMSRNQAQYIEILANRTGVGRRLEDGLRAVLGEIPAEMITRDQASRVINQLKAQQEERRRQRDGTKRPR